MISGLKRSVVLFVATNGVLVFLYIAMAVDKPTPPFHITTKRPDDQVAFKTQGEKTEFSVRSPFGISNAIIQRTGEEWPKTVVLRLHLKEGHFEMQLPVEFSRGNPKSFTIRWIDFYRG